MTKERPPPELERMVKAKKAKKDSPETREGLMYLAKLAAQGRRCEHMFRYMRRLVAIVTPSGALTDEERNYFSSACTIVLEGQRQTYRQVSKRAADYVGVDQRWADSAVEYLELVSSEIAKTCSDVVGIIDLCFLPASQMPPPSALSPESRVFYKKMKGDFLKNMAEVKEGPERERVAQEAFLIYSSAQKDVVELSATNTMRLELEFSVATYYSDIRALPLTAYNVAKEAVHKAKQELEAAGKEPTEETSILLARLESQMDVWNR